MTEEEQRENLQKVALIGYLNALVTEAVTKADLGPQTKRWMNAGMYDENDGRFIPRVNPFPIVPPIGPPPKPAFDEITDILWNFRADRPDGPQPLPGNVPANTTTGGTTDG